MRRLLSITSILCFCLILGSCNRSANKNIPAGADKEISTEQGSNPRAIEHNAPDQTRIDSIKAAKAKIRGESNKEQ